MLSFLLNCKRIYNDFIKDEVTVYAAQASFFIVLSAAPFIMILLTLIQLIPAVSPEDLMHVMTQLLPSSIHPLIESVIQDIQTVSPAALLSVTTVATIWSAARGMLGIERGLNRIIGCRKRRNYLLGRIINSGYTIVFLLMCIFSLVLMVFGSSLQRLLFRYFPMLDRFVSCLISLRTFLALALLTLFFVALYTWLPYERQDIRLQLPGALISTVGWIGCSYGFSIYFNYFVDNSLILENLKKLSDEGAGLYIRLPIIQQVNATDEHIESVIHFLKENNIHARQVNLLPYHDIGKGKYASLDMEYHDDEMSVPVSELMEHFKSMFVEQGYDKVNIGG